MDGIAMTAAELESLRAELNELESDGRNQIAQRIKTAREWGDLKENGEYHAFRGNDTPFRSPWRAGTGSGAV